MEVAQGAEALLPFFAPEGDRDGSYLDIADADTSSHGCGFVSRCLGRGTRYVTVSGEREDDGRALCRWVRYFGRPLLTISKFEVRELLVWRVSLSSVGFRVV
jgi:hypothetical protein